jgi:hypothetical protein
MLKQVGLPGLRDSPLTSKLIAMLRDSLLDVILRGASSFLWMSRQLLRKGCQCSGPLRPCRRGLECHGVLQQWCSHDGLIGIIVLHTLRRGELELSPSLKGDSPRMACNDCDLL